MLEKFVDPSHAKLILFDDNHPDFHGRHGQEVFNHLITNALRYTSHVIYMRFTHKIAAADEHIEQHNFVWMPSDEDVKQVHHVIDDPPDGSILVVDSLTLLLAHFDSRECFQLLSSAYNNRAIKQVIVHAHSHDGYDDFLLTSLKQLTSLWIEIDQHVPQQRRVDFTLRKLNGKIVSGEDGFDVIDGVFTWIAVKPEIPSLLTTQMKTLQTTDLSEQDRINRQNVTLPYLPKELQGNEEFRIEYELDKQYDDWDEEDPDDDLDL